MGDSPCSSQKTSFKAGKLTKNPFFNFLREFRPKQLGKTPFQIVQEGAVLWKQMNEIQREPYLSQAFSVPGPSRRRVAKRCGSKVRGHRSHREHKSGNKTRSRCKTRHRKSTRQHKSKKRSHSQSKIRSAGNDTSRHHHKSKKSRGCKTKLLGGGHKCHAKKADGKTKKTRKHQTATKHSDRQHRCDSPLRIG